LTLERQIKAKRARSRQPLGVFFRSAKTPIFSPPFAVPRLRPYRKFFVFFRPTIVAPKTPKTPRRLAPAGASLGSLAAQKNFRDLCSPISLLSSNCAI
jgi:hypothetical protein